APQALTAPAARPCRVWGHGGGFMHGDLDMPEADHVSRGVAGRAEAVVVSVDYRLCDAPAEFGGAPARRVAGEDDEGERAVRAPVPREEVWAAVPRARAARARPGSDPAPR